MDTKTVLAKAFIAVILLPALIGVQLVNLTRANPYAYGGEVPPKPDTIPPIISILYPKNNTAYNVNYVALTFDVSAPTGPTVYSPILRFIYYKTDWQQNEVFVYNKYTSDSSSGYPTNGRLASFSSNLNLTGIPEGNHSVIVIAIYHGYYIPGNLPHTLSRNGFTITGSSSVNFIIDTIPPSISVLTVENRTYDIPDVPLNFTVNEPVSQITYNLDEQGDVTIAGNTTLIGLSNGAHNLTVYATDPAAHIGCSKTVYFSIYEKPEEKTEQITLGSSFPMKYGYALAAVIVVIIVAMAGYLFVKRKKLGEGT